MKNDIDTEKLLKNFDRIYFGLRSKMVNKPPTSEERARDDYVEFLESLEYYRNNMRDRSSEDEEIYDDPKIIEAEEIDKIPAIDESLVSRLTEKILSELKAKKQEDVDAGIGVDNIGGKGIILDPIGGDDDNPLIKSPEVIDPVISNITQESLDHLHRSIEVLKTLGLHGKAGELSGVVDGLKVI